MGDLNAGVVRRKKLNENVIEVNTKSRRNTNSTETISNKYASL